jgi:1-aminocyclopropane-1-carboxylate deaminase/D-cysteine desulfhydrase-like pyridoxal-dependent ACC family enzyme
MLTDRPILDVETLEARLGEVPRAQLGAWPTPLEVCAGLSRAWAGPTIFAKRDDLSGLALGGNKVRHLEFRMGNALAKGCDVVVMAREPYSNNARQTAAAAAKLGIRMVILIPSDEPVALQGNRLLEELLGADVRVLPTTDPDAVSAAVRDVIDAETAANRRPYDNDAESPNAYGVIGYVAGALELVRQCVQRGIEPAAVYIAAGYSQAGLLLGLRLLGRTWPVVGAAVEHRRATLVPRQLAAVEQVAAMLGVESPLSDADIEIQDAPLGDAFQHVTAEAREAMHEAGRLEGLILDPFYTAKVMACLRANIEDGRWRPAETVIFVHSGGLPAVFSIPELVADGRR